MITLVFSPKQQLPNCQALTYATQHTGSFAQNSFQIDSINSCCTSKKLEFRLKYFKIIYFLLLKPIKGTLGFILEIMKKIARWRQKSEISKRYVKTMISLLSLHLQRWLGCQKKQYDPLQYIYRISSYSFRGNYSFLNLEIQRSQYIRPKVTVCT